MKNLGAKDRRKHLQHIAVRFVPPIFIDTGRWLRSKTIKAEVPEWEYLPGGWPENISDKRIQGWDAEGVVHTLTKTYPSFIESITAPKPFGLSNEAVTKGKHDLGFHNTVMTFAYVLTLAAKGKNKIRFLDWGGGIGHYYKLAKSLFPDLEIEYTSKDMPKLCAAGKKLIPEARFVSDEEDCLNQKYDLVMASTSLHYSQDWQRVLTQLIQSANPYIFVTRFPVIESKPSYVMIQRPYKYGYDTEYIGWCVNKKEFFDVAKKAGAILVRTFFCADADNIIITNAPEQARYQGFLFKNHEIHEKRR